MYKIKQFHLKQNNVFHSSHNSMPPLNPQYQTKRDARSIYLGTRLPYERYLVLHVRPRYRT